MAEWFKAADCKSVEVSHRRFESCSLQNKIFVFRKGSRSIAQSGSASSLGLGGHVFKSHCSENIDFYLNCDDDFKVVAKN